MAVERFRVTSQSRENHTGGHFGVQLNGDVVCCTMRVQNAAQTWLLHWWTYLTSMFDITTQYMLYVRRERNGCIVPDFPIQAPIYLYTGRHAQKYHGVMQTYIIFNHVMKTLYYTHTHTHTHTHTQPTHMHSHTPTHNTTHIHTHTHTHMHTCKCVH